MFSDIVQRFDTPLNALYRERDALRARGKKVIDLVSGNVNRAGIVFPPTILRQALLNGAERARIYSPDPLGQPVARETIQRYYQGEGVTVPASQIVITPGTSVSYLYLFKLLANAGDEILCPTPSYPLLDSIAEFCGVRLTHYRLLEKERWDIDLDHLQSQITPRTRAIVLISPHNPTGAVATEAEIAGLAKIAAKHQLPIISDEVFSAFVFDKKRLPRPAYPHPQPPLPPHGEGASNPSLSLGRERVAEGQVRVVAPFVFTLSGVSKMFALPGLKIGWIAVTGEPSTVKKSIHALDMISDTFLPVNEAAQFALPSLFKKGKAFLARYQKEIGARAELTCAQWAKAQGITLIRPEGGFYITVRLASGMNEGKIALDLLRKDGLLVHPGYFYDLEGSHLVMSYVSPPTMLKTSLEKIRQAASQIP